MPKLLLSRHGQTDWNAQGRWQGQVDIPLNAEGLRQARALRQRLATFQIDAAFTSTLSRAYVTADMILESHPSAIQAARLDSLCETRGGAFEGLTREETMVQYPETIAALRQDRINNGPPGGETLAQVLERVKLSLEHILLEHPERDKNVLVIAHGGILGVMLCHLMSMSIDNLTHWRIDNCSLTIMEYSQKVTALTLFNDTNHFDVYTDHHVHLVDTNLQTEKEGSHNPVVEGVAN